MLAAIRIADVGISVQIVTTVLVLLLACTWVYSLLVIMAGWRFAVLRLTPEGPLPPISILKPLAGLEPNLERNLRTFFEQDYPHFEMLLAVQDLDDPASAVVEKLMDEYTTVSSRLVVTGRPSYSNAKVYSLERLLGEAANDLVVMSDSDTCAGADLLQKVGAEFHDPRLAVSTCPYRAVPGNSLWSRLEATGLNTDFMAGILLARMMEGMHFAVGPTIIARRSVLQSIGGLGQLKDYLAEDFLMGKIAAREGYGVALSSYVIEHHIGTTGFVENAVHRLRWARSTRRSRPLGYLGQLLTMPLPLAILACFAHPVWWPLLPLTLLLRALAALVISRKVLKAKIPWHLLPIEDLAGFAFWLAGFFGRTVIWRGRRYRLYPDGRIELSSPLAQTLSHSARQEQN